MTYKVVKVGENVFSRILAGGQTGVDRGALNVALELGFPCGGWCPPDRTAEDGRIPGPYPLRETPLNASPTSPEIPNSQRTEWNVRDADGTLILTQGEIDSGTALALQAAKDFGRPWLVLDLGGKPDPALVHSWATQHGVHVLNVAGPRESTVPGIQSAAADFLRQVLSFP
jgi:hypothetical protein